MFFTFILLDKLRGGSLCCNHTHHNRHDLGMKKDLKICFLLNIFNGNVHFCIGDWIAFNILLLSIVCLFLFLFCRNWFQINEISKLIFITNNWSSDSSIKYETPIEFANVFEGETLKVIKNIWVFFNFIWEFDINII